MKRGKYFYIFLLIGMAILLIVGIQGYWNYSIYKEKKIRVAAEVRGALDAIVDEYYFVLGERNVISVVQKPSQGTSDDQNSLSFLSEATLDELIPILESTESSDQGFKQINEQEIDSTKGFKILKGRDAMDQDMYPELKSDLITITITQDSLDYRLMDSLIQVTFKNKNLPQEYQLHHFKKDTLFDSYPRNMEDKPFPMTYRSASEYIPRGQAIVLHYPDTSSVALEQSIFGISLSLLMTLAILYSIFILLSNLKKQKKLSDIRDDFVGNITHEFKTPITTASAALEALSKFEPPYDQEKATRYLQISRNQLGKLDHLVDRLMETATLDRDDFVLHLKPVRIEHLLEELSERFQILYPEKDIHSSFTGYSKPINVDSFYLGLALKNVLENAIKYGGDRISVTGEQDHRETRIQISDSGGGISKSDKNQIFEKFYRSQTGNRHDIKGSGIGLYYTKKIIEKHGGKIAVESNDDLTVFQIRL